MLKADLFPARMCHGEDGGMVAEPTGGGESVGVLSRSAVDCGETFQMMRR